MEDLDSYLASNQRLLEGTQNKLEDYLQLQSSILTKKMKDYDVSKMITKESGARPEDGAQRLRKELLTNNTTFVGQFEAPQEFERKKKIFMTENVDDEGQAPAKPARKAPVKLTATRNTRYDVHLTESSQVPGLKSNIGKKQGVDLIKSTSMSKLKQLDTNEVIEDCDVEMTNYQDMVALERGETSAGDRTASEIIQNKLNQFMTANTESSFSRRIPRVTNETTLGSIMDVTETEIRGKFLTQNNKAPRLDKYQMIRNQFRTNKPEQTFENKNKSQYLRTVVQNPDLIGPNWETRIEEEGVEMGEIMMDETGNLRQKTARESQKLQGKLDKLKQEQELNELAFEKAKRNPEAGPAPAEPEPLVNQSIHSELFKDTPKKRESSKSPEVLVLMDSAPKKKRKFQLGKRRRKTPDPRRRQSQKKAPVAEQEKPSAESEHPEPKMETKDLSIEMPKKMPMAIELDFGFEGRSDQWTRRA